MPITRETIKEIGVTDDNQITKLLDTFHAEIDPLKTKADQYDAEKARADQLKQDYDDQTKKINALKEASGDVEKLNATIDQLKADAATKDKEHQKAIDDMQAKLDATEFDKVLDGALTKAGAKRLNAVKAELDLDALRASKNRDTDIAAAVDKLKEAEETAFLFGADDKKPTGAFVDTSGRASGGNDSEAQTRAAARAVMGLSTPKSDTQK